MSSPGGHIQSEATPSNLLAWTNGRAIIGTGSPFPPVLRNGVYRCVDQTNNAYVFPGIGLGVIAVGARRVSDGMLLAAAHALAETSPARIDANANLLRPVSELRQVSFDVALAVANQAQEEGLAAIPDSSAMEALIRARMWAPAYSSYRRR